MNKMPAKQPPFPVGTARLLTDLGQRLREARLRRHWPAATVAARARISRTTLFKAELGHPAIAIGTLLRVLQVLGLEQDLTRMAADDTVGRRLQDLELGTRSRSSRGSRARATAPKKEL